MEGPGVLLLELNATGFDMMAIGIEGLDKLMVRLPLAMQHEAALL